MPRKYLLQAVVASAMLSVFAQSRLLAEANVPVAPICAESFEGWTNAMTLKNPSMSVIVVPSIGRIAQIRWQGEELLRLDSGLKGRDPGEENADSWLNFGGDWLWPVAQSRWTAISGKDWPPPPVLAEKPWSGKAWRDADGSHCCLMEREYGEPLNIKVSRLMKLNPEKPRLNIRQRIERTAFSEIPVTLWHISQVCSADEVVIAADSASIHEGGVAPMMFGLPGEEHLSRCSEAVVYRVKDGEHKLCSDSARGWIAARRGEAVLVTRASGDEAGGSFPDGGCTVEMYSNSGLGYSEIETLSVERNLAPGESLQNTLTMECFSVEAGLEPCELAGKVRTMVGEVAE